MGVEVQDLVGWLITIALAVIGWFVYKLQAATKENNDLLKADIKEAKDDAEKDIEKVKSSYKSMGERLNKDILSIRESVVFTDVFAQHEKLEDLREKNMQQMYNGLSQQLNNINNKIDTLIKAALEKKGG